MPSNPHKPSHLIRGELAEQKALQFLLKKGLRLIHKNYRCGIGELDLVMDEKQTLVIVEVRYRQSDRFGGALESITAKKQSRIIAATKHYIMKQKITNRAIRFDVVALSGDQHINWIKNAFQN